MTILAIVGMPGAGKSSVTAFLKEKGYPTIRFGGIIVDEVKRRGLPASQQNEQLIREELRRNEGMDVVAKRALPKIRQMLESNDVIIIDGVYSFSEYKTLKEEFGATFIIIAIYSPPIIRYKRLGSRDTRPLTNEEARIRDHLEIERIEKAGPIAMADYTLCNIGTVDELLTEAAQMLSLITKG